MSKHTSAARGELTRATAPLTIRRPRAEDGAALWDLVRDCGVLSVNSSYSYVLMADMFPDTCAMAVRGGRVDGAVIGFRPPKHPTALFVWQIGVHPRTRGAGVGQRMLDAIYARKANRDLNELLTTVTPDNRASERLFHNFAARHGATIEQVGGYPADFFPESREAERLFRISGLEPGRDIKAC